MLTDVRDRHFYHLLKKKLSSVRWKGRLNQTGGRPTHNRIPEIMTSTRHTTKFTDRLITYGSVEVPLECVRAAVGVLVGSKGGAITGGEGSMVKGIEGTGREKEMK